jgi:hypothetical protein
MPGKTRKVGKKQEKAEKKAHNVAKTFKAKVKSGKSLGHMFLAKVVSVSGGGRFVVEDLEGKKHTVRVAKALFHKAAKHRNATMVTAVHIGSNVLVDADTIRSVVGAGEAAALRKDLKASSNKSNSLFSHGSRHSSKSSKSSKGVNINRVGGFCGTRRNSRRSSRRSSRKASRKNSRKNSRRN